MEVLLLYFVRYVRGCIKSLPNRRPIRYENWNGAIAIRYDGNSINQWESMGFPKLLRRVEQKKLLGCYNKDISLNVH